MTLEEAYQAYRNGDLTYQQYREQYADPIDNERLARKWREARRIAR